MFVVILWVIPQGLFGVYAKTLYLRSTNILLRNPIPEIVLVDDGVEVCGGAVQWTGADVGRQEVWPSKAHGVGCVVAVGVSDVRHGEHVSHIFPELLGRDVKSSSRYNCPAVGLCLELRVSTVRPQLWYCTIQGAWTTIRMDLSQLTCVSPSREEIR